MSVFCLSSRCHVRQLHPQERGLPAAPGSCAAKRPHKDRHLGELLYSCPPFFAPFSLVNLKGTKGNRWSDGTRGEKTRIAGGMDQVPRALRDFGLAVGMVLLRAAYALKSETDLSKKVHNVTNPYQLLSLGRVLRRVRLKELPLMPDTIYPSSTRNNLPSYALNPPLIPRSDLAPAS